MSHPPPQDSYDLREGANIETDLRTRIVLPARPCRPNLQIFRRSGLIASATTMAKKTVHTIAHCTYLARVCFTDIFANECVFSDIDGRAYAKSFVLLPEYLS